MGREADQNDADRIRQASATPDSETFTDPRDGEVYDVAGVGEPSGPPLSGEGGDGSRPLLGWPYSRYALTVELVARGKIPDQ